MAEVNVCRIDPSLVDTELTAELHRLAQDAWASVLPDRRPEEIAVQFNVDDPAVLEASRRKLQRVAAGQSGGLLVAHDVSRLERATDPIGYIWAENEVSGSLLAQVYKRTFRPDKVYAKIGHVCVKAPYHGQGVGSRLVGEIMDSFDYEQIPTAYVIDENEVAKKAMARWGLRLSPDPQVPRFVPDYFGESWGVNLLRYAGRSVRDVQAAARAAPS
jgi:GNAT superfamily N-acetyltransferase